MTAADDSNIHMKAPVKNKISKPDFAKWLKGLASWRHQQPTAVESEAVKIFTGFQARNREEADRGYAWWI